MGYSYVVVFMHMHKEVSSNATILKMHNVDMIMIVFFFFNPLVSR